jgi:hypothetical protein
MFLTIQLGNVQFPLYLNGNAILVFRTILNTKFVNKQFCP